MGTITNRLDELIIEPTNDLKACSGSFQEGLAQLSCVPSAHGMAGDEVFTIDLPVALVPLLRHVLSALNDGKTLKLSTF